MDWTWEVTVNSNARNAGLLIPQFVQVYAGESLVRAVVAAVRAKRTHGYVKVEWR